MGAGWDGKLTKHQESIAIIFTRIDVIQPEPGEVKLDRKFSASTYFWGKWATFRGGSI
jgi:hypothetical protein